MSQGEYRLKNLASAGKFHISCSGSQITKKKQQHMCSHHLEQRETAHVQVSGLFQSHARSSESKIKWGGCYYYPKIVVLATRWTSFWQMRIMFSLREMKICILRS